MYIMVLCMHKFGYIDIGLIYMCYVLKLINMVIILVYS